MKTKHQFKTIKEAAAYLEARGWTFVGINAVGEKIYNGFDGRFQVKRLISQNHNGYQIIHPSNQNKRP